MNIGSELEQKKRFVIVNLWMSCKMGTCTPKWLKIDLNTD